MAVYTQLQRCFAIATLVALCTLTASCANPDFMQAAKPAPALIPEEFFNGKLSASGIVKDRSGNQIRYFNAVIDAYWQDGVGTLEEDFVFDDGEEQRRVWRLRRTAETTNGAEYIGTAGDVVGDAIGTIAGNQMRLKYVLKVPYKNGEIDITIDDRMYLVNDNTLVNESRMTKFGFHVGEIVLVIRKETGLGAAQAGTEL